MSDLEDFAGTFRLDDLTVLSSERWVLSVRPAQMTLGSMVLSSRAGLLRFADMGAADGAELAGLLGRAETAARDLFGAVRVNAVCLMMKDPIVHFHLLPRYGAPVEAFGRRWVDADWPGPPNFGGDTVKDDEVLTALRDRLRTYLG